MTTARVIVRGALTYHLNKLSPGEAEDADLFGVCLDALTDIVDGLNGAGLSLFREALVSSTPITGASAQLGTAWASIPPGTQILGATVKLGGQDTGLSSITMEQYAGIGDKATTGSPTLYAYDGASTVFLWGAASQHVVTLRTRQALDNFADLDTDYPMPAGYRSAFAALLAEKMAPTSIGGITPAIARASSIARVRLRGMNVAPAIVDAAVRHGGNILTGWR